MIYNLVFFDKGKRIVTLDLTLRPGLVMVVPLLVEGMVVVGLRDLPVGCYQR